MSTAGAPSGWRTRVPGTVSAAPVHSLRSVAELQARLDAERAGRSFLLFRDGDDVQHVVSLVEDDAPLTIGRRESHEVCLGWDTEVSRVHAELCPVGGDWTLIDDGLSRNGSYVNEHRVLGRRRLCDGDVLRIGTVVLHYRRPPELELEPTVVAPEDGGGTLLTPTQRRILVALCRPYRESSFATPASNLSIAQEVHLSVDAVKTHLRRLFVLLGVDGLAQNEKRAHLAWRALTSGLISARELLS